MIHDNFNGGSSELCASIEALLELDASGALVPHGIGGHARALLSSAAARLSASLPAAEDARDAARWKAVKVSYGSALVRLATGSNSYNSAKKDSVLDTWADMAAAEVEAFDPDKWMAEEVPARIAELERNAAMSQDSGKGERK